MNVAYLADDTRRMAAFKTLKQNVGLTPEKILHAPIAKLRAATRFGILPDRFADKLRECAQIALDRFSGDLKGVVAGPVADAPARVAEVPRHR